jgi:hypothetical protein
LKVAEELVDLLDVKILTGKSMAVKIILKWEYDMEIERLKDL